MPEVKMINLNKMLYITDVILCMYNSQSFGIPEKDGTSGYVRIYTKYATQHNKMKWSRSVVSDPLRLHVHTLELQGYIRPSPSHSNLWRGSYVKKKWS